MGCDIHFRVERRDGPHAPWQVVAPTTTLDDLGELVSEGGAGVRMGWPYPRQYYYFFALVAGVRNWVRDFGSAVVVETPIAPGRGLPDDMASPVDVVGLGSGDDMEDAWERAEDAGVANLGDHSFTWATLRELQDGLAGHRENIDDDYCFMIWSEWPKLGDPDNVRIIMGFDS